MTLYKKTVLKQAYNRFAAQRDQAEIEPWKFEERERFVEQVLRENRTTLLEIGAGTGRDSFYFEQRRLSVTCTDLSEEMVKLCKEKGLNAYCMDFSELTFDAESFDAVFALSTF
ncbi:class I SAM-dependent methyltransferase [Paenibacillus sp. J5C_2022]|uniref:class I SAM-dependent DNA methyltransferase n=1 Tax=Paenibacillus sp. J5C2022 TaxID=2977129 RepID=UPI0021D328D3|nr:class I SAM-dependent methyltransferase [Paenibacillus sp. J5C2022]MCU6711342.1 class I SAM-dependent methyltransferase [Paenibacillus sp. J5C2022]